MHAHFVVVLFVLSLASCKCGLLNWFTEWTGELDPQITDRKCRERREAEENEKMPEITNAASDKIVSLMDIEEGKLTAETEQRAKSTNPGYSKTKRCPKNGYVGSIRNLILGAPPMKLNPLPLVKRESEEDNEQKCKVCMSQPSCKFLRKCHECDKYCKPIASDLPILSDNQTGGIKSRMANSKKDDIFSKTLYPISTYREGETKEIICKIIGITDSSDIETVTIWVTTFSNNPPISPGGIDVFKKDPRKQENLSEHKLRQPESKPMKHNESPNENSHHLPGMHMDGRDSSQPELEPRFNNYDIDEDSPFPKMRNRKENPDVIEGPPPFLRSNNNENLIPFTDTPPAALNNEDGDMKDNIIGSVNKDIIVQPKEFISDESDEAENMPVVKPVQPEESTVKNIVRPSLLSRLKQLTTPKTNTFSTLKGIPRPDGSNTNRLPSKEGFLQNLKSSQDTSKMPINYMQNMTENVEMSPKNNNQNSPYELPGEPSNQISEINKALQEVKTLVKNMQEDSQKASEKRLLGASHTLQSPDELVQKTAEPVDISQTPTNPIHLAVPPHVVDNFKKVNKYFIDRAQDALDTIRHPTNKEEQPLNSDLVTDDNSDTTKKIITDFKKMPQFLLDKFKDTLNGFEKGSELNPSSNIESGVENVKPENELVELSRRFGGDSNLNNIHGNEDINGQNNGNVIADDPLVSLPEQSDLIEENPTAEIYKSKFDKYLAELKKKRQKIYSPEKFVEGVSTNNAKIPKVISKFDKPINSQEVPIIEDLRSATQDLDQMQTKPSIIKSPYDLEKQRDLLRGKLRKYIDDVMSKKASSARGPNPISDINSSTNNPVPNFDEQNIVTNPALEYQAISNAQKLQKLPEIGPFVEKQEVNEPKTDPDPLVGESNLLNNIESNDINHFLPTMRTANINSLNQITQKPNKFLKYLEDLKAKRLVTSTIKPALSPLETANSNPLLGATETKTDLLKDKIKQYVANLKKPVDESAANFEPRLTPRGHEELTKFNKINNDIQDSKKDMLKKRLKNYIHQIKKPTESIMDHPANIKKFPELVRKSTEAQQGEINALKNKLASLLKERTAKPAKSLFIPLPTDPIIAESQPSTDTSFVDNDLVPVIRGAEDLQHSRFVNNEGSENILDNPRSADNLIGQLGAPSPTNDELLDTQDVNLGNRGSFAKEDLLEWSNNLGQIVQSSSKPKDVFFIGNGIKLPLQIKQGKDGSMDLSVDIDKLCSCRNSTCPKNHAAIEETVGEILKKEAELKNQLKNPPDVLLDDVKIEPVRSKTHFGAFGNIKQRLSDLDKQNRKSNIFKRSSEIGQPKSQLTPFQYENSALPKLPTFQEVASELTNFGKQLQKSFANSIHKLEEDIEILNNDVVDNMSTTLKNPEKTLETNLKKIKEKSNEINNDFVKKLENKKNLDLLLNSNGIANIKTANKNPSFNVNEHIKNIEREKTLRKLLQQLELPQIPNENALRRIENQANYVIKNTERTVDNLIKNAAVNRMLMSQISTTQNPLELAEQLKEKLKNTLPVIPKLQDKVADINNNLVRMSDAYQYTKINALENKLKQLDNEVDRYEKENGKLFAEESQRFFGGRNNKVIQKEVNIIGQALSWLNGLSKPENSN